jgi:hypothetical protein
MKKRDLKILLVIIVSFFLLGNTINAYQDAWENQKFRVKYNAGSTAQQDTIDHVTTMGDLAAVNNPALRDGTTDYDYWYLVADTTWISRIYRSNGYMSYVFTLRDTSSGGDSSAVEFKIYAGDDVDSKYGRTIPALTKFALIDSFTVSTDSTATPWVYTSSGSDRPNVDFWYMTAQGTADNKTLSAVMVEIEYVGKE